MTSDIRIIRKQTIQRKIDRENLVIRRAIKHETVDYHDEEIVPDWNQARLRARDLEIQSKECQDILDLFIDKYKVLESEMLKLYLMTPKVEGTFGGSLMSPTMFRTYISGHMMKRGMPRLQKVFREVNKIEDFHEEVKTAMRWLLKLERIDKKVIAKLNKEENEGGKDARSNSSDTNASSDTANDTNNISASSDADTNTIDIAASANDATSDATDTASGSDSSEPSPAELV